MKNSPYDVAISIAYLEGACMGQKEALNQSQHKSQEAVQQSSGSFVELHIEDLVKDRLLWQAQVGRRAYPSDGLPSVIHILESSLTAIR